MKRSFMVLTVILLFSATLMAAENPVDKGSFVLDGSVFFQTQTGDAYENLDGDGYTTFAFMPSGGFFVAPGFFIGADITFWNESQGDYSFTEFVAGPMVGYYFNLDQTRTEAKGAIYPFLKGFFNFGQWKADDGVDEFTTDITQFGGHGGIIFMVSNAVGIDFSAKFWIDSFKPEGFDESIDGTNIQIGAGVTSFIY